MDTSENTGTTNELFFNEDGDFRILIIADAQDTNRPQEATLSMINSSLDAASPDLVIFLGDQIHGPTVNRSEKVVAEALDKILTPVVERNIPFAFVFGNHDDEGKISKETQLKIYQSYPGCLAVDGPDITGCGNYYLPVYSPDGKTVLSSLWFFDSGTYNTEGNGKYAIVEKDQCEWFQTANEALTAKNNKEQVPAYVFQHIIVPEIYDILQEVPKDTEGAVKGFGSHSEHYYILGDNFSSGNLGEGPCPPDEASEEFDVLASQGNVVAAFFGHDHVNDFVGTLDGIDLINTPGTGFYIYGAGENHGTRLLVLHADGETSYDTEVLYYKDVVSDKLPYGIISTQGAIYQNLLNAAIGIGIAAIIGIFWLVKRKKKGRHIKTK